MTDKEVDVLLDFITMMDDYYICEYMCSKHKEFCEENCKKCINLSRNCVKEYAKVRARRRTSNARNRDIK